MKPLTPQAQVVLKCLADRQAFPHGICRADAIRLLNIQNLTARLSELRSHGIRIQKQRAVARNSHTHRETSMTYWRMVV